MMVRVVLLSLLLITLVACSSEPEYIPDNATLAAREQAEYQAAQSRIDAAWKAGMMFIGSVLLIVVIMVAYLSRVGYRIQAAKATRAENEARRILLVDLGNGAVLDLGTNTIRAVNYHEAPAVQPAVPAQGVKSSISPQTRLQRFVIEAAAIVSWDSSTIPRWSRWSEKGFTMTGAEWMRITDELVQLGLVEKSQGSETMVVDGNLRDLYFSLPTSPTGG